MKRIICILMSLLFCLSFVGCNGRGEENSDGISKNAKIYGMYATEKYMRDKTIEQQENASMNFIGIKNEIQSAQLTFTAKQKINTFNFEVADLTEKGGGAKISKDLFSVYVERYIEIYNPFVSSSEYLAESGFYPDALVPIEKYKIRSEDMVEKGNNQALWIDVNIPKDAKAGEYEGVFKLTLNEEVVDISVSLVIYDLEMPDEVNWPSHFAIWYQQIGYGEGDNLDENTYQAYYEFLWSKRLNCSELPPEYATLKDIVDYVISIIDNPKFTSFIIPAPSINQNKIYPKVEGTYTEQQISAEKERIKNDIKKDLKYVLDRNLELRETEGCETIDILKKAIYRYEDEPSRGQRAQCVRIFCELLQKAKKELVAEYADTFVKHPDLLESLMNVNEICASNYFFDDTLTVSENPDGSPNYDLSDGLTWWCPEADYAFDRAAKREYILERQALGEKVWWYVCISNTPRPSYYVESLPINIRMMSWQQHRWGVEGVLYWDIADFQPSQDTYEDIQYESYGGGEGILVYPGARYGMKTPISSWRLEQIRLGQQDLELFTMLDNYLKEAGSTIKAQDVSIAIGDTMYKGTTIFDTTTSKQFEDHRIWLLDVLGMFKSGQTSEALNKINEIINV